MDSSPNVALNSVAVVRLSQARSPVRFNAVDLATDLTTPIEIDGYHHQLSPDHESIRLVPTLPSDASSARISWAPSDFSSFQIAEGSTDLIGSHVDIVSDAENIKKLMKLPYSQAPISMAVHRIGKTLLLDGFDVDKFQPGVYENQQGSGTAPWVRKIAEQQEGHSRESDSARLAHDGMYNKLLYYTLAREKSEQSTFEDSEDGSSTTATTQIQSQPMKIRSLLSVEPSESEPESSLTQKSIKPFIYPHSPPLTSHLISDYFAVTPRSLMGIPTSVSPIETKTTTTAASSKPKLNARDLVFQRIVHWTFQDLSMLVGSNMLIFGDEKHPAVSLKLRDASKPINVLTGIDDWLDNLMCNVPEVAMCFHINGLVQSYELIKTEDIPNLRDSAFSPVIVLDTAQNLLAFLKDNCTREGGTYWLCKSPDDDVIKLYDLSSLTEDGNEAVASTQVVTLSMPNKNPNTFTNPSAKTKGVDSKLSSSNPFALPVAMLLYRVAKNMSKSKTERDPPTQHLLLSNCLQLLEGIEHEHPIVYSSAHYLLAELFAVDGIDAVQPRTNTNQDTDANVNPRSENDEGPNYMLPRLGLSGRSPAPPRQTNQTTSLAPEPPGQADLLIALDHLRRGLRVFEPSASTNPPKVTDIRRYQIPIITKIAEIMFLLSEIERNNVPAIELNAQQVTKCLRWLRLCVPIAALTEPRTNLRILITAADAFFRISVLCRQADMLSEIVSSFNQYSLTAWAACIASAADSKLDLKLQTACNSFNPILLLETSVELYESALLLETEETVTNNIRRRVGNIWNELGSIFLQQQDRNQARLAFNKSVQAFLLAHDSINSALVLCNLARVGYIITERDRFVNELQGMTDAIDCYKRAKELLRSRSTSAAVYDAVLHELGQGHFMLATFLNQMQDSVNSVEDKAIFDHFLAAISCFEEQLRGGELPENINNKVRTSLGISHFRLARKHYHSITQGKNSKQIRTLALSHYASAINHLHAKRDCLSFVQARLELTTLTLLKHKEKANVGLDILQKTLACLIEIRQALSDVDVAQEELSTLGDLCKEAVGHVQQILREIIRHLGTGSPRKESYEFAVRTGSRALDQTATASDKIIAAHALFNQIATVFSLMFIKAVP